MMAATMWPNLLEVSQDDIMLTSSILPFNKSRTRAIHRIGPHNLDVGKAIYGNNGLFSLGFKFRGFLKVLTFKPKVRQLITQVKQNLPEIPGTLTEDFIERFQGFVDREGCFNVQANRGCYFLFSFQIGLHKDDVEGIIFIQRSLGFRRVWVNKNVARFRVSDQAGIKKNNRAFPRPPA